tara:strand:- start:103 stop:933 length:831 start_codon:yes stop_codon:yes gene_type:complete
MNIIGLGKAGCAIAEKFNKYPQYNVYKMDVGLEGERCLNVKAQRGPEEYEANSPSFKSFFRHAKGSALLILGGSGNISAMSLRVLESIKDKCDVSLLYIRPDRSLLSGRRQMHEKVTYNVLQNYARSGAISRMYLVSNPQVESILGEVPIMGYFDKLNELIVSTIHMINVFKNSTPVLGALREPGDTRRICTVGIYDMEKDEEKLFFSLDTTRESCYIYCVGERRLHEDGSLHKTIVTQMKGKTNDETPNVSFGVFQTNYETDYGYVIAYSPNIQN